MRQDRQHSHPTTSFPKNSTLYNGSEYQITPPRCQSYDETSWYVVLRNFLNEFHIRIEQHDLEVLQLMYRLQIRPIHEPASVIGGNHS